MKKFTKEFMFFLEFISKKKLLFFLLATILTAVLDLSGIASVGAFASILVQGTESKLVMFLQNNFSLKAN